MEEMVDVIDSITGDKTGEVVSKREAHSKGIWHSSIHILLVNKDRTKILLQKRCADKKLYPNRWDITVGGHISAGENPLISAHRELEEELGLDSKKYDFKFIKRIKEEFINNGINSKEFVYVYLIEEDVNCKDIVLQKEEVSEARWFKKEEFLDLIEKKLIINHYQEFEILKDILV
ncbi:MAG TPA: NUDIX hydrolase [Firmicutes bacterium]|nr:NUDIX hydrolase [Bacillota bacterium]